MARRKGSPQEAVVREMMRGYRIPYEGALREISPPLTVCYSSSHLSV